MKAYRTNTNSLVIYYKGCTIPFVGKILLSRRGIENNFNGYIFYKGTPSQTMPGYGPFKEVKLSTVFREE